MLTDRGLTRWFFLVLVNNPFPIQINFAVSLDDWDYLNIHENEKRSKSWPTVSKRMRHWPWVSNDALHSIITSHQYAHRFCASFCTYNNFLLPFSQKHVDVIYYVNICIFKILYARTVSQRIYHPLRVCLTIYLIWHSSFSRLNQKYLRFSRCNVTVTFLIFWNEITYV